MHRHVYGFIVMILAAAMLAACGSADKGPAETALKAAEAAVNAAKTEVSKYMPDQAGALDGGLAAARDKFNKGDFKGALSDAQAVTAKANELVSAVAAKKAELSKAWQDISTGMPKVVEAIQSRVDILSQSRSLRQVLQRKNSPRRRQDLRRSPSNGRRQPQLQRAAI